MAKNTAECGKREERALVKALQALGYEARRQPGSGNRDVDLQHDVVWKDSPVGKLHIECKFKSKATWKTCESDRDGADILVMREARDKAKVFIDLDLFLQLVGSAAERSEILSDLPPDKPWATEAQRDGLIIEDAAARELDREMTALNARRAKQAARFSKIQEFHQNPPRQAPKPNKLKGRGFGK